MKLKAITPNQINKKIIFLLGFILMICSSCSVQKKQHSRGYHIERNRGKVLISTAYSDINSIDTSSVSAVENNSVTVLEDSRRKSGFKLDNLEITKVVEPKKIKTIKNRQGGKIVLSNASSINLEQIKPILGFKNQSAEVTEQTISNAEEIERPEWIDWIVLAAALVLVIVLVAPSISITWGSIISFIIILEAIGGLIGIGLLIYGVCKVFQAIFML